MLGGVMFLGGALLMAYNLFMTVQSASTAPKPAQGFGHDPMLVAAE
jgi:cbb3-type cytochrome oxidase subunit 1